MYRTLLRFWFNLDENHLAKHFTFSFVAGTDVVESMVAMFVTHFDVAPHKLTFGLRTAQTQLDWSEKVCCKNLWVGRWLVLCLYWWAWGGSDVQPAGRRTHECRGGGWLGTLHHRFLYLPFFVCLNTTMVAGGREVNRQQRGGGGWIEEELHLSSHEAPPFSICIRPIGDQTARLGAGSVQIESFDSYK